MIWRVKNPIFGNTHIVFSPRPMLWAMPLVQISAALGCQATVAMTLHDVTMPSAQRLWGISWRYSLMRPANQENIVSKNPHHQAQGIERNETVNQLWLWLNYEFVSSNPIICVFVFVCKKHPFTAPLFQAVSYHRSIKRCFEVLRFSPWAGTSTRRCWWHQEQ